jgi:DNA-binding transcriptional LysR family regulator
MRNSNLQKRTSSERPGQLAWDDLRTVLAIVRTGSLSGAARALEVEHSTVFRRLEEIERRLGTHLFERSRSGYLANAHGESVAEAARIMEEAALSAERRVLGADARLTGTVRIATSEMLGTYLLPRLLEDFLAAHPDIEVEVEISNRAVDLNRREADLALRATMTPPEHLIARKVGEIGSAIYATAALAQRIGPDAPLHALPWIGFEGAMSNVLQAKWMREVVPGVIPRLRMDSFPAIIQAAALGVGVGVLPAFAAAQEPRLVRISDVLTPKMNCWLLTHPDVRDNARVRALLLHIAERTPPLLEKLTCEGQMCEQMVCANTAAIKPRGRRKAKFAIEIPSPTPESDTSAAVKTTSKLNARSRRSG